MRDVYELKGNDAIYALIGNKLDLEGKREVTREEGENFANEKKVLFHEVSAKTGTNFSNLFYKDIFDRIILKFRVGTQVEETQIKESKVNLFTIQPMNE